VELFHFMTGRSMKTDYRKLSVAPVNLKAQILTAIKQEIANAGQGKPAHVIAKMNSLEDPEVIAALTEAARAGVRLDLIVRGICCLVPRPTEAQEVRVISVVGRFLEHSRIAYFRAGAADPLEGKFFLSSADWMERNLNRRVEAVVPIEDAACRSQLWDYFQLLINDQRQTWDLRPDGSYVQRVPSDEPQKIGVHEKLMRIYQTSQREWFNKAPMIPVRTLSVVPSPAGPTFPGSSSGGRRP
jgi:polyphosphate kinase